MIVSVMSSKKEFSISVFEDDIIAKIEELKSEYEENEFVTYGTSPEFLDNNFKYITAEEYTANVDKFLSAFKSYLNEDFLKSMIEQFPKKKNGSFNRKNVVELTSCNNCIVIHEWHNTWIYYVIKVSAFRDYALSMTLFEKTDTPC